MGRLDGGCSDFASDRRKLARAIVAGDNARVSIWATTGIPPISRVSFRPDRVGDEERGKTGMTHAGIEA